MVGNYRLVALIIVIKLKLLLQSNIQLRAVILTPQSPRQRMAGLKTLPRDDNSGFLVKVATRVDI